MGDYMDLGVNFSTVESLANFIVNDFPNQSGIYILSIRSDSEKQKFLKFISSIKEKCSIVFEEASKFCTPRSIPTEIYDLIHYGRHHAIDLIFTARRAAEISRDVTSQSTAIISFQQTEPKDISILKQSFSEAKKLPDLRYNPKDPANNNFMVLGNTSLIDYQQ